MNPACGRARRELWPDSGPKRTTPEVVEAQAHVAGCSSCTAFFDEMRRLSDDVRSSVPRTIAPLEVRNRLFKAISFARIRRPPRARPTGSLIAIGAIGAIAATMLLITGVREFSGNATSAASSLVPALAEEHARAVGEPGIRSSDPSEISQWLKGRLSFAIRVPVFAEASLTGARVIELGKRRGVLVEYAMDDDAVSYFVVAASPSLRAPPRPGLQKTVWDGYHVVSWAEPGLLHAFVGNVSEPALTLLARKCIEQAGGTMAVLPEATASLGSG